MATKNWTNLTASTTARAAQVLGNDAFAEGDINPHSEGTLADNQFKLGTTTARYSQIHGVLSAFGAAHVPSQAVDVYGNIHFGGVGTAGSELFGSSSLCSAGIQIGVAGSRLGNFNWNSRYKTLSSVAGNYAVASGPGAQIQFNATTRFLYLETAQSQNADGTAFTFTDHISINGQSNFIGIGHANPSQTLDVLGSIYQHANGGGFLVRLSNSSTAAGVGHRLIGIGAVAGSVTFDVGQNAIGNNAGYEISYQNAATVCFFVMPTSSVQIGIGHASPSQTLDVKGNLALTGRLKIGAMATQTVNTNTFNTISISAAGYIPITILTGVTGEISITTINGGTDGDVITVHIYDHDYSTPITAVRFGNSGNINFVAGSNPVYLLNTTTSVEAFATLIYSSGQSKWNMISMSRSDKL